MLKSKPPHSTSTYVLFFVCLVGGDLTTRYFAHKIQPHDVLNQPLDPCGTESPSTASKDQSPDDEMGTFSGKGSPGPLDDEEVGLENSLLVGSQ